MVGKSNQYYIYILSNNTGTLYTGVTNDLIRRLDEHKRGVVAGFTKRYHIHRLIYFEETNSIQAALEREKQIKGWARKKKLDLIQTLNPTFVDLSEEWME